MKTDDLIKVLDKAAEAVKEEKKNRNYIMDAWLEGFVKACSDRGADAEGVLDLLLSIDNTN